MQKGLCSIVISGVLAFSTSAILAQSDNSMQQQPSSQSTMQSGQMHSGHRMDPDQQLAHLTKALNLTSDQQSQIKPILVDRQQQLTALRQDTSSSKQDKMAKAKSINNDAHTRIEAALNDQQKQKFEEMQAKEKEHMQKPMGGNGGSTTPQ